MARETEFDERILALEHSMMEYMKALGGPIEKANAALAEAAMARQETADLSGQIDRVHAAFYNTTKALRNHIDSLDKRLLRLEPATKKPDHWTIRPVCTCKHPDADFLTSMGERICSYCGDRATQEAKGPRDLRTRQNRG